MAAVLRSYIVHVEKVYSWEILYPESNSGDKGKKEERQKRVTNTSGK